MMACIAVITLNGNSVFFSDNMVFFRQNFGESIPIVGIKYTVIEVRNFAVKPGEGFGVPFAEYPSDQAPSFTIHGFDKPELVGLLLNEMPHFIELNLLYFKGRFPPGISNNRLATARF